MSFRRVFVALVASALLSACAGGRSAVTGEPATAPPTQQDPIASSMGDLGLARKDGQVPALYGAGHEARATELQRLLEGAVRFFADSLGLNSRPTLAVLDERDWSRATTMVPYGIPYFEPNGAFIVLPATTDGSIVAHYMEFRDRLPAEQRALMERSGMTFEQGAHKVVDLIGLHELGHLLMRVAEIRAPSHWVNEFLATAFGYAYLRAVEPRLADAWDGIVPLPHVPRPRHTSLADFDRLYFGVGPANYFWYQGVLAERATEVIATRGLGFLRDVSGRGSRPAVGRGDSGANGARSAGLHGVGEGTRAVSV